MIKITTIGGGNGQSHLLDALIKGFGNDVSLKSIVSMSDDGRTTGELMRLFESSLGLHLPPTGDLRRCLFTLSSSSLREFFIKTLESKISSNRLIKDLAIEDLFNLVDSSNNQELSRLFGETYSFKLDINEPVNGHKLGNLVMGSLYYNLGKDYNKMLDFMHEILEIKGRVIPVTTKRALIKAVLSNGDIIETQDRISNEASYNSGISDLELMECSKSASQTELVKNAIIDSDYLLIGPGDLFTSIISNFIIGGVRESIIESKAKVIYIGNNTNKGGETSGLTHLDCFNKIERFLGKQPDYFISNNKKVELDKEQKDLFKNDISIKGGDFLYLSNGERQNLISRGVEVFEGDLIDQKSIYKHNKENIIKLIKQIIY